MDKKLIIANWKNHPDTLAEAQELLEFIDANAKPENLNLVICPPFVFIEEVAKVLETSSLGKYVSLGAQDIAVDDTMALTGEVSGPMLAKLGVRYVIIGHSERRWKLGESDEIVNKKLKAALRNNLVPIVCLGEKVRDNDFVDFLYRQTQATFDGLSVNEMDKCIVAYEPVWAISTNPGARPDTPESTGQSISVIWEELSHQGLSTTPLTLYGGSVNSENVEKFLKWWQIAGVLVGGASVRKEEFVRILGIASGLTK